MLYEDLQGLIGRLDRIFTAVNLACDRAPAPRRSAVADAMVDTCWEGVRLGHELTRRLAYDDLWNDLETVLAVWERMEAMVQRARLVDVRVIGAVGVTRSVVDGLTAVADAVTELESAQLIAVVRPRDRVATGRAQQAINDLEAAADRVFISALLDDAHGRLDAALAVLSTAASRAARERAVVTSRQA